MSTYIFIFSIIIVLSFTVSQVDRLIGHFYFKLTLSILVLFIGLRYQVGGDWYTYLDMYNEISKLDLYSAVLYTDPAYGLLNWISYKWSLGIYFVNFSCAVIFSVGLYRLCVSLPQPWFALLISTPFLVTVVAMGYSRQAAATGFGMIALVMLLERRAWKFIFYVFMASLFHKTALFYFLFFPLTLPPVRIGIKILIVIILICVAFILLYRSIGGMWAIYITQGMESRGGLARVLLNTIPGILFLSSRHQWYSRWPHYYGLLFWLSIISIVLLPLQFLSSTVIDRVSLYVIPLQMIVFSTLPLLYESGLKYLFLIGSTVMYFSIYIYWLMFSYYAQYYWIPYDNILFR
ncbi:EpsG family protein [Aeromonas allosaccharophila]|uniref:EpsG family protein n=1 Tax=Aeromonas allosaccharophila TaxID=656 RepID=UPI003D239D1D